MQVVQGAYLVCDPFSHERGSADTTSALTHGVWLQEAYLACHKVAISEFKVKALCTHIVDALPVGQAPTGQPADEAQAQQGPAATRSLMPTLLYARS
jgi:hypothetical protein